MKFNFSNLEKYLNNCRELPNGTNELKKDMLNRLTSIYLRSAIKNTPVGIPVTREVDDKTFSYSRGTTIRNGKVTNISNHAALIKKSVKKGGKLSLLLTSDSEKMRKKWGARMYKMSRSEMTMEIFNSASYSLYVDVGHRQNVGQYVPILGKRLVAPFVPGLHITDKAQLAVKRNKDNVYKNLLSEYIRRTLDR